MGTSLLVVGVAAESVLAVAGSVTSFGFQIHALLALDAARLGAMTERARDKEWTDNQW